MPNKIKNFRAWAHVVIDGEISRLADDWQLLFYGTLVNEIQRVIDGKAILEIEEICAPFKRKGMGKGSKRNVVPQCCLTTYATIANKLRNRYKYFGNNTPQNTPHTPIENQSNSEFSYIDNIDKRIKEEEEKEEISLSSSSSSLVDFDKFKTTWNDLMKGKTNQEIKSMTPRRKAALEELANEFGKDAIFAAMHNLAGSAFLNGKNKNGMVFGIDWFIVRDNFVMTLEGKYNDAEPTQNPRRTQRKQQYEIAQEEREAAEREATPIVGKAAREEYLRNKDKYTQQ